MVADARNLTVFAKKHIDEPLALIEPKLLTVYGKANLHGRSS